MLKSEILDLTEQVKEEIKKEIDQTSIKTISLISMYHEGLRKRSDNIEETLENSVILLKEEISSNLSTSENRAKASEALVLAELEAVKGQQKFAIDMLAKKNHSNELLISSGLETLKCQQKVLSGEVSLKYETLNKRAQTGASSAEQSQILLEDRLQTSIENISEKLSILKNGITTRIQESEAKLEKRIQESEEKLEKRIQESESRLQKSLGEQMTTVLNENIEVHQHLIKLFALVESLKIVK